MKTITEFSGILLQRAAEAQRTYRAEHPQIAAPAAEPTQPSPEAPAADAAPEAGEASVDAAPEAGEASVDAALEGVAGETAEAAPTTDAPAAEEGGEAAPEAAPELGTGPEAEAVGAALGFEGDRLKRLMEALDVVGRRGNQVRLVRVIQGENPPQGAQQRGEFFYVVDLMPRPQSPQRDYDSRDGGDRRRGPGGGRDRGGRPGGGGGGDRGPGGAHGGGQGGTRGKFSNDRPSGRDGDSREARGEMPRAGAGWTLTRAPEERRGGRPGEPDGDRRDRRPPRGPSFDHRGPRPPMGAGPGPGAPGDRSGRGPRPDGRGGRPGFGGPRPGGAPSGAGHVEGRGNGQGFGGQRPGGRGPGGPGGSAGPGGPGPRRPEGGGNGRGRFDRNQPARRRGGWDEPATPEAPITDATTAAVVGTVAPASAAPASAAPATDNAQIGATTPNPENAS